MGRADWALARTSSRLAASGENPGLFLLELLGGDDVAVPETGQLLQLVCPTRRRACGCGREITAGTERSRLELPDRPVVHGPAADDQVHNHADQREDQYEQEPQRLGAAGQVMTAEDVDEYRNQGPDPDSPNENLENRPENVQQRIRR